MSSNPARAGRLAQLNNPRRVSKIGHGAALAVISWYLMVPPVPKPNAPLHLWQILKTLTSRDACEAERVTMVSEVDKDMTGESGVITFETPKGEKKYIARAASCVATTDPRLHHRKLFHRRVTNPQ